MPCGVRQRFLEDAVQGDDTIRVQSEQVVLYIDYDRNSKTLGDLADVRFDGGTEPQIVKHRRPQIMNDASLPFDRRGEYLLRSREAASQRRLVAQPLHNP